LFLPLQACQSLRIRIAENIAVDIFLAIMPVTFIWSLNMAVKQRINLCFLLGLGFM
jgi:hypothetical protein